MVLRGRSRQFRRGCRAPVDPEVFHPVHQHLIMKHGIYLHEGMALDGLASHKRYEFVYAFAPCP